MRHRSGLMNGSVHYGQDFSGTIVYSFHATKPFGIGEGGLIYSKNEEDIQCIKRMGNFGFDTNRECTMMGFNCKMSESCSCYRDCDYEKMG